MRLLTALLALSCAVAAEKRPVSPETIKPIGPYSPGILTSDFLYVSGQGAKNPQGETAPGVEGQLRQCFENVKAVVGAGGLTMDHVVYAQVYLTGPARRRPIESRLERIFPEIPARARDARRSPAPGHTG
jgi:enamine deaminase RidA (YjgF/YER057c/UK114 family)